MDIESDRKIIIEAGHLYADSSVSVLRSRDHQVALLGAELGGRISAQFAARNINVCKWVLLDDLHGEPKEVDVPILFNAAGFNPTKVIRESKLVDPALELIDEIREASPRELIVMRKGYSLKVSGGRNILLAGRTGRHGYPTEPKCALLDAAFAMKKIGHAGENGSVVTILPDIYASQQSAVKRILQAVGLSTSSMSNLYFPARRQHVR